MIRTLLFATTVIAMPLAAAYAQSCPSQASMDATANATWQQVLGDNVAECGLNGSGPQQKGLLTGVQCYPPTLLPGDVTPTNGLTVTDAQGNVWGLYVPPGEDGNGQWYGGLTFNGQQVSAGYFIAIRKVGGIVYVQEAKGSGWQIADPSNPGDSGNTWTYVGDPGPSSGCGSTEGASFILPPAAAQPQEDPPADPAPTSGSSQAATDPPAPTDTIGSGGPACLAAGAITPGDGSFTDSDGNVYTVDPNNNNAASINGQPLNDGAYQTAQLATANGIIYGQSSAPDNLGQWEQWMPSGSGGGYWQPLSSTPAAIMPASSSSSACTPATQSTSAASATGSGTQNPASGVLPDLLQICGNPATTANSTNATLCLEALQSQAAIQQAQNPPTTTPAAAPVTAAAPTTTADTGSLNNSNSGGEGNGSGDGGDAGAAGGGADGVGP